MPQGDVLAAFLVDTISPAYSGFRLMKNPPHILHQLEGRKRLKLKVRNVVIVVSSRRFQNSTGQNHIWTQFGVSCCEAAVAFYRKVAFWETVVALIINFHCRFFF